MTSQRKWQLLKQAEGKCIKCGKPRKKSGSAHYCKNCVGRTKITQREAARRRLGYKKCYLGAKSYN